MAVDEELLAAALAAQARVLESERAVELARAEFRYGVRKLHLAGASLREIGDALNLSHQRVHQIVEEAGDGHGWRSAATRARGALRGGRTEPLACSFCGKPSPGTGKFVEGNGGIGICDSCIAKASQVLTTGQVAATPLSSIKPVPPPGKADAPADPARCSFCGKGRHQVTGLAAAAGTAASGVRICDECLALCREIIADA